MLYPIHTYAKKVFASGRYLATAFGVSQWRSVFERKWDSGLELSESMFHLS